MTTRLVRMVWLSAFLLVAACTAAPTATPTPTPTEDATPTPTAAPTEEATPTPEATDSAEECTSEPPTSESDGWTEVAGVDDQYAFSLPADWDVQDPIFLPIDQSLSPETFADTGLPDIGQHAADLATAPDGSAAVSAFVIQSMIDTPTEDLFAVEVPWLEDQPQIVEVHERDLEACIDGSPALGFSSTWTFPAGNRYIELYMLQRNGEIYQLLVNAVEESDARVVDEIIRTWEWSEPLEGDPGGEDGDVDQELAAGDFDIALMTSDFDDSDPPDDPPAQSTSESTFAPDDTIWFIYRLDDGVTGTIIINWRQDGDPILEEATFDYSDQITYAWAYITPPSQGYDPGSYDVVAELDSGDSITVPFEIEP